MKYSLFLAFLLSVQFSFGQSTLTSPKSDCQYTMQWTCDECTFNWTGDCTNNLLNGQGILTVFHESTEIMRYEGGMENGVFNGEGKYRDEMNQMEGTFKNGYFVDNSPLAQKRNAIIDTLAFNKTTEWELKSQITKQMDNLYFTFPAEGYGYKNREMFLKQCVDAFSENCKMINDPEYTEFTRIMFVDSKEQMLLHSDLYITGGVANIHSRSIHMLVSDKGSESEKRTNPPIKHEIMHMVSMTAWGPPPPNVTWLNEGLATYAANNCSGYTVSEIYRFFLEKKMLLSIDTLANNFRQTKEMISYHQSACIVEYLIKNFGIEKFEIFWKNGYSSFEPIYGISYAQLVLDLNKHIMKEHPIAPAIDWSVLKEGCKTK